MPMTADQYRERAKEAMEAGDPDRAAFCYSMAWNIENPDTRRHYGPDVDPDPYREEMED